VIDLCGGTASREQRHARRGEMIHSFLTEQDVSRQLNISVASLRRWRVERRGPTFIKVGSLVRYRPEDLELWLSSLPTGGSNPRRPVALRTAGASS
jgi:hypothetical protein